MATLKLGCVVAFSVAVPAIVASQTPAPKAPAPRAPVAAAAARPAPQPLGSLAQIMRGIYFPNANLIFDVQQHDPGAPKKPAAAGDSATSMYGNAYGGSKNQEKVSDATNNLADACSSCHEIYRDKGPADSAARCTPPAKP